MQTQPNPSVYYRCKYLDDLFFFAIPISSMNKDYWRTYFGRPFSSQAYLEAKKLMENNKESKAYSIFKEISIGQAGVRIFKQDPDNEDPIEQWIVLASQIDIADPHNIPRGKIEMTMLVTTSLNANFIAHMGISRTYDSLLMTVTHSQISMPTHAFSASFIKLHYGNAKKSVKSSPVSTMREVFKKAFKTTTLDKFLVDKEEKFSTKNKHKWFKKYDILSCSASLMEFKLDELTAFLPKENKIERISIGS